MRFYTSYTNRRHKSYGAGILAGDPVHTRGWNAGVRVTARDRTRDEFDVYMTSGSHESRPDKHLGTVSDTPDGPRWEPADPPRPARIPARVKTAGHPLERYAMPVIAAIPVAAHLDDPEPGEYICVVLTGRWASGDPVFGTVRATREGDDWVTESRGFDMSVLGSSPGPRSLTQAATAMVQMTGHSRPPCTRPHAAR